MPGWSGCDVCLTGFEQNKGGFLTSTNICRQLKLPEDFKVEDIHRAQRDCEMLAEVLRDNPEEVSALLRAVVSNKVDLSKKKLSKMGLTEKDFAKEGGGSMWLVVIAVLLYATDAC